MEISASFIQDSLNKQCFVIIMDLDKFKSVNDTYGHLTGDEILKGIVKKIRRAAGKGNIVARYGGEEFIFLVKDEGEEAGKNIAEAIRKAISSKPFIIKGNSINATGSFGVAKVESAEEFDKAIQNADEALYKAKEEGRNRVVFYGY